MEVHALESIRMLEQAFRWGVVAIVLAVVIPLGLGWFLSRRKRPAQASVAYRSTKVPFSDAEVRFLGALDEAVGHDHRVFAKMRVADLLSVGEVDDRASWQRAFNRISAKHVDFVVCRRDTLEVAAVELDDRSHDSVNRLARVPVRSRYEAASVRASVLGELPISADEHAAGSLRAGADDPADRRCHVCGSPMKLRRAARRAEGVQEYHMCTNVPRCHVRVAVRGNASPVA